MLINIDLLKFFSQFSLLRLLELECCGWGGGGVLQYLPAWLHLEVARDEAFCRVISILPAWPHLNVERIRLGCGILFLSDNQVHPA
jgi:hypothetical protein